MKSENLSMPSGAKPLSVSAASRSAALVALLGAGLLGGCTFLSDALLPGLDTTGAGQVAVAPVAAPQAPTSVPALESGQMHSTLPGQALPPGDATGTTTPLAARTSTSTSIMGGPLLSGRAGQSPAVIPAGDSDGPLAVVRFDSPDMPFEQALGAVTARALEQTPEASFDVVALAPAGETVQAQAALDRVLEALTTQGMAAESLRAAIVPSTGASVPEVRLYIR